MGRSTKLARFVVLAVAAILLLQVVAFVVPPSNQQQVSLHGGIAAGLMSALAAAQPALATDGSAFDSWGAPELTAVSWIKAL